MLLDCSPDYWVASVQYMHHIQLGDDSQLEPMKTTRKNAIDTLDLSNAMIELMLMGIFDQNKREYMRACGYVDMRAKELSSQKSSEISTARMALINNTATARSKVTTKCIQSSAEDGRRQ